MAARRLTEVYLRIAPDKFHYLKFLLEGYDNLAILSSHDSSAGIVVIRYPQAMAQDLFGLLRNISPKLTGRII